MPGYGRRELVRGMLRDFPLAGFEHGAIVATTATLLFIHVRQHGLGTVVSGHVGFILARSPDVVRGADVAFVCAARLKGSGRCVGYWDGPPDLAVEVASPSDSIEEIEEKLDDYLNAGTPMVWVINPRRRTVSVHRAGANPVILREHDALDGQEIVEGFRCMVSQLFE
jgi:Uma2 family endonuclease